jgi:hypothetical protein
VLAKERQRGAIELLMKRDAVEAMPECRSGECQPHPPALRSKAGW